MAMRTISTGWGQRGVARALAHLDHAPLRQHHQPGARRRQRQLPPHVPVWRFQRID